MFLSSTTPIFTDKTTRLEKSYFSPTNNDLSFFRSNSPLNNQTKSLFDDINGDTNAFNDVFHQFTEHVITNQSYPDPNSMSNLSVSSSRSSSPQVLNDSISIKTNHSGHSENSTPHEVEQRFSPSPINFLPSTALLFSSPPMSPTYVKTLLQDSNEDILLGDQDINMAGNNIMGNNMMGSTNAIMRVGIIQFRPVPAKADSFFTYPLPTEESDIALVGNSFQTLDSHNHHHHQRSHHKLHDELRTSAISPTPSTGSSDNRKVRVRSVVQACADPELELQRRRRLDRKAELARVSRQQRNQYVGVLNEKLLLIKNRLLLYEDEFGNCRHPDFGGPNLPLNSTPINKVQPLIIGRKRSIDQAKSCVNK